MLDYEGFEGPTYNLKTTPVENHQRDRYWISRFKGNVGIAKGLANNVIITHKGVLRIGIRKVKLGVSLRTSV